MTPLRPHLGSKWVFWAYFMCNFLKNCKLGQAKICMPKCTTGTNLKKPIVILANAAVLKIELIIIFLKESVF